MDRNRYVDLLRVLAIGGVVYGHWLLVSITYTHGQLSGLDAISYVSWAPWVTWAFQVMPVFFLVGGYVNAQSWPSRQARGETWTVWVRDRALRLLWPTAVFVVVGCSRSAPRCWRAQVEPKLARRPGSLPCSCGSCPSTCCWPR